MDLVRVSKKSELMGLLSVTFYCGSIIFAAIIAYLHFGVIAKEPTTDKLIWGVFYTIIGLFGAFFIIGWAIGIYGSINLIRGEWDKPEVSRYVKICSIINFIPLFISLPIVLSSIKITKHYEKGFEWKTKKEKVQKQENNDNSQQINSEVNQFVDNQQKLASNSYPINEPFLHNNKWMYYDGIYFYETNDENQWVRAENFNPQ